MPRPSSPPPLFSPPSIALLLGQGFTREAISKRLGVGMAAINRVYFRRFGYYDRAAARRRKVAEAATKLRKIKRDQARRAAERERMLAEYAETYWGVSNG